MVMDQGWCASAIMWRVRQGASDGVNLGGRTVVLGIHFPGPTLFDGNATARLYIDQGADAAQRRELEAIFQGKKGGPPEVVGGFVSKWLSTQATRIDVKEEGDVLTASVGNVGKITSQPLKNEAGQPMTMQNTGFQGAFQLGVGNLAPSTGTQWSDRELPSQFSGKSGVAGNVSWRVG
jgi:hypothetical protein